MHPLYKYKPLTGRAEAVCISNSIKPMKTVNFFVSI